MVGNNTPVFFMRDPMKFQHFIRSQKRRADSGLRDHDMQWDFWTLSPETAHQVTWLMGDRGIPRTYRHMNGYSSHTYMWVNAQGQRFWVKYHFKTDQGIECLTQEEADRMAGEDADYHRRDLFEAIKRGDHPSWTLKVQVMPFEEAKTYRFNPFDLTKVWPHGDYPLIVQADSGQCAESAGAQLQQGWGDASAECLRPGLRAELEGWSAGRPRAPSLRGKVGGQR
jgi:catalase